MLREGRRRPWRGQPRTQRQRPGDEEAPRRCSPPGVGIIGDVQSSAGASRAALDRPKQRSPQYSQRPTDAHDSPPMLSTAQPAPTTAERHPSTPAPTAAPGRPKQHRDAQSSAPRSTPDVPPMPTTAHRCPRQPNDAQNGQRRPRRPSQHPQQPSEAHDDPASTQTHRHPQQHWTAQSSAGTPKATLGRPKQRWDIQSSTGTSKAALPAVLSASHRCHRQPTDAADVPPTPTTAQPAVPGPGERPSGAIMTPPVRPPRRALGRTRGEPPLIREKPAIPAKNTRRSNRGRPARERLRPVSRHLHPMSHNTCAPRENGAGRHASRAGGI